MRPLNILTKTKHMLSGKDRNRDRHHDKEERRRALSASAGDVTGAAGGQGGRGADPLPAAASEPDLRDTQVSDSQVIFFFRFDELTCYCIIVVRISCTE